ncbi:MAG TPA: hypothetical protein P5526_25960 [Anaerolineae bacterium]|nr:hypothetical protein [Anaerolineae bacterium]
MNRKLINYALLITLLLISVTATAVLARNARVKEVTITLDKPTPTPTPTNPKGGPKNIIDQRKLSITMHHEDTPTSSGNVVYAVGVASGLGNVGDDTKVNLQMAGTAVLACINHGGTKAPGQNSPPVTAEGSTSINPSDITKNGNADFVVQTGEPTLPDDFLVTDTCPNDNWTVLIDFVLWHSATVTLTQAGENTVVNLSCQTNGLVDPPTPPTEITCTE